MVTERDGPLTLGGPHPPDDRLQADAVLVRGPDLNRLVRVLCRFLRDHRGQLFFKHLALLRRGPGRMARARLLHRPIDRLQGLPAALGQNRSEPEFASHPSRHFGASPQATVGRRRRKPLGQPRQKLRAQHARCAPIAPAQVTQGIGPVCVVAGEQLLNPARHEARHRGDIRDRVTPR